MAVHDYNRAKIVDANFRDRVGEWSAGDTARTMSESARAGSILSGGDLVELLESQMMARHLDIAARNLRTGNESFYTIGSAGHEGNALVGRMTRATDPAFLHYRSGGFMMERSRRHPEIDPIRDTALSIVASTEDPISGGRHKVWGSAPLWVLPQTSTIASHLPKAMGMAISIRRTEKLGLPLPIPANAIVVCSFGDASANHSTGLGALNAAAWASYQRMPVPLLCVCEDNGIGISVRTPPDWIEKNFSDRAGIRYFSADGLDMPGAAATVRDAIETCRSERVPVFLHLRVVRLLGHAGTDIESTYRDTREIEATEARDPVLITAKQCVDGGFLTPQDVLDRYEAIRDRVDAAAKYATTTPKLATAAEVIAPLAPYDTDRVNAEATKPTPDPDRRERHFKKLGGLPESRGPRHLAAQINAALHDVMLSYPEALVFGEDVARKGGVYNVTAGLHGSFRAARVFNTILDEQSILGMAQGAGYCGLLPIPEIQYLAYFHNACDQIRGEACSTQFFSNDQFRNPMVLRIASLAYQRGFGGHFHNDNSIAALRDIPGLIIACPSRGDDAAGMLRTALALAKIDGRIVAYLEPIALYMTKDLHEERDRGWSFDYPAPGTSVPLGEARVYEPGATDLLIATYGNGVPMSLRAARSIERDHGAKCRILDLRWLNPLPVDAIARHAAECQRTLVVDEGRRTGGVGEAVLAAICEHANGPIHARRVTGEDTYIPLGPAAHHVLPSEDAIVAAAAAMLGQR